MKIDRHVVILCCNLWVVFVGSICGQYLGAVFGGSIWGGPL